MSDTCPKCPKSNRRLPSLQYRARILAPYCKPHARKWLMPLSCFSSHTLSQIIPQHSVTQCIYMIISLSRRSNRLSLSRQQGIILIKTANAVIPFFSSTPTIDKKWILSGKQGLLKVNPNWKETGMECYSRQQAVWQDNGINTLKIK